jgi:hypothetical protein
MIATRRGSRLGGHAAEREHHRVTTDAPAQRIHRVAKVENQLLLQ